MTPLTSRNVRAGGVDLVVAEDGAGGRPILLLHGFTGAKEDFTRGLHSDASPSSVDLLVAAGWHVAVPDQRGHGESGKPDDERAYSWDRFADDAVAVADALGWGRFTLLGHSMGGVIAQALTVAHPERVARLVLMDTSHQALQGVDRSQRDTAIAIVREQGIEVLADAMAAQRGQSPLDTEASLRLLAERPGWGEFGDRKVRASAGAMYVTMLAAFFEAADRLPDLASVTAPTLVIVGEQDAPFLGPSERMASAIPGARLEVIPDAGHSPQFENPDAWWKALSGFLAETEA
jgi:pimeloyl-ACP methyl ester carboxylesterase